MPMPRFMGCDFFSRGSSLGGAFICLGYAFSDQLEQIASAASRWSGGIDLWLES